MRPQVLLVDDNPQLTEALQRLLRKEPYDILTANSADEALGIFAQQSIDVVVSDEQMPGMTGSEFLALVRCNYPDTMRILLTGQASLEATIRAINDGEIYRFLTKPCCKVDLSSAIQQALQQAAAREAQRQQAMRDLLTGVWNRAGILDVLQRELALARREGTPVSVVMADLDHFKWINDTHGHLIGDTVLRETVRRMLLAVRPYDAIGRYGGEEFLLVLPGCDVSSVAHVVERIRTCIAREAVQTSAGLVSVTCSFGVAAYDGTNWGEVEELLRSADGALYRAKNAGRNRVVLDRVA